jgi:hypothetical protein
MVGRDPFRRPPEGLSAIRRRELARLDSSVNLDGMGNPDPYHVSIEGILLGKLRFA